MGPKTRERLDLYISSRTDDNPALFLSARGTRLEWTVHMPSQPADDPPTGYAITLPEGPSRIDIATEACTASATTGCQRWTLTIGRDAVPGRHEFLLRPVGLRSRVVGDARIALRVLAPDGPYGRAEHVADDGNTVIVATQTARSGQRLYGWGRNDRGQLASGYPMPGVFDGSTMVVGPAVVDAFTALEQVPSVESLDQIVLAGDSAGGYLALALAQRLQAEGEEPAALVAISPLLQLDHQPKLSHPNIHSDALFSARAFDALVALVARAAAKNVVDGEPEGVYEPLDHIEPGLPRTLIHVSGSEVLLHDARLAARRLAAAGVPTEVRVWPGQIHDFQMAAPLIPEATRSLRQIGEYIREATE